MTALGGGRASSIADDDLGEGPVAALSGSLSRDLAGGELSLGGGYDHQPRQDNLVASTEYRHELGTLAGDFVRSNTPTDTVTQYSLGLQTTFVAGAGALEVAGKTTSESLDRRPRRWRARLRPVRGARQRAARRDDRRRRPADARAARLPRLRAAHPLDRRGPAHVRQLAAPHRALSRHCRPARLEGRAGDDQVRPPRRTRWHPVRGASITGKGVWSETDDDGYFQIEAADDADLTVTTSDGRSFSTVLPAGAHGEDIARIGEVVCCAEGGGDIRLGALDLAAAGGDKGSR
jgi:hypothetical protein